jgi:hypothetical protein
VKNLAEIEKKLKKLIIPGLIFLIIQLTLYLFYPNWFTTNENTIDPWIYWGAGDNLQLSYSNDFARTYYLQRYVVILPQFIFQTLLGPYFGTLGVGIFWSLVIFFFIWRICLLIGNLQLAIFVYLVFVADRALLGAIGMSYTMGATVGLGLGFLYFAMQLILFQKNITKKSFQHKSIIAGVLLGLLANAYLTHAIILSVAALMTFGFSKPLWLQFKQLVIWCFSGFLVISLFFQIVYKMISNDSSNLIFSQLSFGLDIATNKNPWNGGGFFDFWTRGIFEPVAFYWISLILISILISLYNFTHRKKLTSSLVPQLSIFATSVIFVYFIPTLFYLNPIGYSWGASSLYLVEVLALIIFGLNFQNLGKKNLTQFVGLIVFFFILVGSKQDFFQDFVRDVSKTVFLSLFLVSFCFLVLNLILFNKSNRYVSFQLILISLVLISFSFLRNSTEYGQSEGGMQDSNPRKYYETISSDRKILLALSNAKQPEFRIWLTPGNKVPLVSSQLYAYSLISRTALKPDCDQVNWARGTSSLIVSFNQSEDLEQISKIYINPCGFELLPFKIPRQLVKEFDKQYVVVGYLN